MRFRVHRTLWSVQRRAGQQAIIYQVFYSLTDHWVPMWDRGFYLALEMFAIACSSASLLCWALGKDCLQLWRGANIMKHYLIDIQGGLNSAHLLPPHLNGFRGSHYMVEKIRARLSHGTASTLLWELGDSDSLCFSFIICKMGIMVAYFGVLVYCLKTP